MRTAGVNLTNEEEAEQFHTSLPGSYNEVRTWWSLAAKADKMYKKLQAKAKEIYEFSKRDDKHNKVF